MKLLNRDLGALKSKYFLPSKSKTRKSAAHPVSINRSVFKLSFKDFVELVGAEP